jgi:tetratricopeptide (TPR) repeat protein
VKTLTFPAVVAAIVALSGSASVAQNEQTPPPTPQQLFESGEYPQALSALHDRPDDEPMGIADHYLASLILLRTTPPDVAGARRELDTIGEDPDEGWKKVAESARLLLDNKTPEAVAAATEATKLAPDLFAAHYQLGLARAKAEDWAGAAQAFERATQINPGFAYAHYYAGIAYSRLRRTDVEAEHFRTFVKLAPKAPERLAVESILRTLRGR